MLLRAADVQIIKCASCSVDDVQTTRRGSRNERAISRRISRELLCYLFATAAERRLTLLSSSLFQNELELIYACEGGDREASELRFSASKAPPPPAALQT